MGGSRVLYVAGIDLAFLAWQDPKFLGDEPLPRRTWEALRKVPYEFVGMGVLMTGIWWVIDRRQRLAGREERSPGARGRKRR